MRAPANQNLVFGDRLREQGVRAEVAADLIEGLVQRRRWTTVDNRASRLLVPPHHTRGEKGLRIHFESFGRAPALEFALAELRRGGRDVEADALHVRIVRLDGRAIGSTDFPSLSLLTLLDAWERGARDVVAGYARARTRAREPGARPVDHVARRAHH